MAQANMEVLVFFSLGLWYNSGIYKKRASSVMLHSIEISDTYVYILRVKKILSVKKI